MDILPAIDLRSGRVVRLLQGDYDRQIDYADDPVAVARDFQARGATWLHVVDLDGAKSGRPENIDTIRAIVEGTELRVEVGGGIRDDATAERLLGIGVTRVVIGTRALRDWEWFAALAGRDDMAGRVMLGLDAREGRVAVAGWTETMGDRAVDVAARSGDLPLGGIIYTDIATDGMLTGPNLAAMREMVAASPHPVIASGGVHVADDVAALTETGVAGAIIGRAIYEGTITVEAALAAAG